MYGFQIVQLIINSSSDFKIFDMSKMNNFKLVLNGRDPNKSDMDFVLEAEGQTQDEIHEKIQKQITNLKLYLNLYSDNAVDVKARYSPEVFEDKSSYDQRLRDSLDSLRDANLPNYLNEKTTQQHILLQTALDELKREDMFNAFPKLINWLDDNDGKGSSRFCCIRDSCDHGRLDQNRAMKNTNDRFPSEFEFEDYILKRDSKMNKDSMQRHLPEVLDHIKRVFKRDYVN